MITFQSVFDEAPLVAILRGVRPDEVVPIAEVLYATGFRLVEVPLNSPQPLESISALRQMEGRMIWGAGTVLECSQVDDVAAAGGRMIVSPNTNPAVISRAVELGLESLPGFATATEAFAALAAGARRLKLFPAATYGANHLKALKAVLPQEADILPVGGVGPEQMPSWLAAGASGFGLGSDIYRPGMTADEVGRRAVVAITALRVAMEK